MACVCRVNYPFSSMCVAKKSPTRDVHKRIAVVCSNVIVQHVSESTLRFVSTAELKVVPNVLALAKRAENHCAFPASSNLNVMDAAAPATSVSSAEAQCKCTSCAMPETCAVQSVGWAVPNAWSTGITTSNCRTYVCVKSVLIRPMIEHVSRLGAIPIVATTIRSTSTVVNTWCVNVLVSTRTQQNELSPNRRELCKRV